MIGHHVTFGYNTEVDQTIEKFFFCLLVNVDKVYHHFIYEKKCKDLVLSKISLQISKQNESVFEFQL